MGRNHELYRLAALIDWPLLEQEFGALYSENSRPGIPIRLMAGLCYPSHAFKTSDEETVRRWLENPYHQYFCGQEYFCHKLPIDPSSLCRFCKRIGEKSSELILQVTVQAEPGNPYGGYTLARATAQVKRITGQASKRAFVDRGYCGHKMKCRRC